MTQNLKKPVIRDQLGKPLQHQNVLNRTHLPIAVMDAYMLEQTHYGNCCNYD